MPNENQKNGGSHIAAMYPQYKGLLKAVASLGFHDHLCLIYESPEEQFAAVVPFIRIGLERGEKCIYIADDNTSEVVLEQMSKGGIDVKEALASGALSVITKRESYLKQGYFDPDWMIRFLKETTGEAKSAGYVGLRATGEMTWMLGGDPGSERLIEYEAKLNYFFPENDALAICQYNINRFDPSTIKDVIRTHPMVIYRGQVCRNFYYVPPDEMLLPDQGYLEVGRLLYNIVERERLEELGRQSEENLGRIEEELSEMQRISQTGSWEWDAATGQISWSDGTYRIFGMDPGMPTPDYADHLKLYTDESANRLKEAVERALKTGEPYELDLELAASFGGGRWVVSRGEARRDGNKKVAVLYGSVTEITGRKRAEMALRESEERFRGLAENIDTVFWVTSADSAKVLYVNSAFEKVWGRTAEELDQDPKVWFKAIHPEDRQAVMSSFERWISGNEDVYTVEYRIIRPDGEVRWVEDRSAKIRNEHGYLSSIAGIAQDITGRKLAGEEQRRTDDELQRALGKVKFLSGLIPICAYCKKIRNDHGYWEGLEKFIREHSEAEFTHCICPDCAERFALKDTGS